MLVRLTLLADSVAAAGTALLLGAAAMSHQQDPAAAYAPFDARAHHSTSLGITLSVSQGQGEPREIAVVAKKYAFEPERIEVTEGEPIRLVLTSDDSVHGLEIKKFNVNKKIPRGGDPVTIDFVATAPGEYPILCSEYCGKGHKAMRGTLVVAAGGERR